VCLVAVVDGALSAGDRLVSAATGQEYDANEVIWLDLA
jgi:translation elongation factor EF-4